MYSLYHNKELAKIEIKKDKISLREAIIDNNEVKRYNDCYYICNERKPLAVLGNQIKKEWIEEQREILAKLEAIKNFR